MPCLPYWHDEIANAPKTVIGSGCVLSERNLTCDPETVRVAAERWLNEHGYWKGSLPMDVYALARYINSEVGSGTPEERVGVGEAALHQAQHRGTNVTQVLVYNQKGEYAYGYFGPIDGGGIGRWASTRQDPRVVDILTARLILSGESGNFTKGALDQDGLEAGFADPYAHIDYVARERNQFWVGHLPGVNPWVTFLQRKGYGVAPEEAKAEMKRLASWRGAKLDWARLQFETCRKPFTLPAPAVITGSLVVGAGLVWLAMSRSTAKLGQRF